MSTPNASLWQQYRSIPIIYRIATAFLLGSILGLALGQPATALRPLGDLFVRLLKMLIIPIVFFTLVLGARRLTPSSLGAIGGQVLVLYLVTTAIAIVIGLGVGNLVNPGIGLELESATVEPAEAPSLTDVFLNIVPTNPVGAMADGNVLGVIFFAVVFGLALALLQEEFDAESPVGRGVETIFDVVEAGAEAMFKIVWGVMEYGVIGVFALMAAVFGKAGYDAILPFLKLIGAMALAVGVHIVLIYLLVIIAGFVRGSPASFLVGAKDAMITALSIRSSSGTLPVTMSDAEENLKIDEEVYSFSLPLGATINMDGTAMYQGIAAIFAANLVGETLTLAQQRTVVLVALLASFGTAGVPGSGVIMLTLVLTQLGLPLEVAGMVVGVDPILDRLRTMNNVTGDLAVTTLVAKWNDAIDLGAGVWGDGVRTGSGSD
ncbi:dicarboxylate/amino acid:cation symporter [Haladaptatus sp. DYSN1]|uniref:dicarboxylate/amino acid:cation symporter n=1 Tax=unclassified Haladaptatus TaxID=2622732 RepID=UPI002406BEE8|nr:dicarboxylate/amino acid:cation symporter [Haladaptatus sp. DYSN1]